jgi:hypothetical protein
VTCAASPVYFEKGNARAIQVYSLVATASTGTLGTVGFVERQVAATAGKCRLSDGLPPSYDCP